MDLLDELGEYPSWQSLSGIKDDKRMRGAELILRFLALASDLEEYEKPLANFLNKFAQKYRYRIEKGFFDNLFKSTVDGIHELLGKKAFRLLDTEGNPENNFNAAIFDAQMVSFARVGRKSSDINNKQRIKFIEDYINLQNHREYNRSISASTSDPPLVSIRINMFKQLVEKILSH